MPARSGGVPRAAARRARMAPSPGLQLRCLTSLLSVPILILRPQLSSLWWFQPPVSTATCPRPCQLPPSLSRRQRLAVTKTLNNQWQELPPPVVWDPLLPWRPDPSPVRWHCRRACHHQQRRQAWAGWPHRGMRIGEAQNPGPPLPSTPAGRERSPARQPQAQRVFCPVPACPCSDPARARGWATVATMKSHIDAHLAGSLQGDVPTAWLHSHNRTRCLACGLNVSQAHGVHPTCRPEARAAAVDAAIPMDTDGLQLPSLSAIQAAKTATIRRVPSAARHAWAQVLTRALAAAAHRNDDKAWRELCMLPKCVLCAPHRGGRQHRKATAAYTLGRLHRWQEGEGYPFGNPALL